jgi:hypothetical protein
MCTGLFAWVRDRFWATARTWTAMPHRKSPIRRRRHLALRTPADGPNTSPCISPDSTVVMQVREINGWDEV